MKTVRSLSLVLLSLLGLAGCTAASDSGPITGDDQNVNAKAGYTKEQRNHYLHTAHVFVDADIPSKDVIAGPQGKGARKFNEEVTCKFIEPTEEGSLSGTTNKFECTAAGGDKVRVKYSPDANTNGGLYGEILGTRLLWTLGFAADRIYPVRVTCLGCPENPWAAYKDFKVGQGQKGGARADRKFPYAVIEEKYEGKKIEEADKPGEGWSFEEFQHTYENEGGASLAEIDALKLLGVFMKYADSKAANQRLVCLPGQMSDDGTCGKSIIMMQDLGVVFGAGSTWGGFRLSHADPDLGDWTKNIWKDKGSCQGELRAASDGTLSSPHISEAGRQALLARLKQLSDKQLHDLFTVGRVLERGQELDGRPVTLDDWITLFKQHVNEIAGVTCPR